MPPITPSLTPQDFADKWRSVTRLVTATKQNAKQPQERPAWLRLLHERLDAAVLDAYGWPHDVSDEGILERLLALNQARAARKGGSTVKDSS